MGIKYRPKPSRKSFRFGNDVQPSLGHIPIRVPIGPDKFICEGVDVVNADIPFLIGLDFLDRYKFYVNTVENLFCNPILKLNIPVIRKMGHVYLVWTTSDKILFTKSELHKLHRGFSHPANDKLLNLLKLARPYEVNSETKHVLDQIKKACDTCQRFGPTPIRFKVFLPSEEDIKFGEELSLDLMWLDGKAVLHVVDTATRFSAASFLDSNGQDYGQSVEGIWLSFIEIWCAMYTGYPNRLRVDQGSAFTSDRWRQIANNVGVQLRLSGVKAHNSLGIGERLHSPLRRIFNKIRHENQFISKHTILKLAVKAMNDTIGENSLVPSRLVFGITPRFPIISSDIPTQKDRMNILKSAQMEMNAIIAERRILAALNKEIPPAADRVYKLGDEVLTYSEKQKEWIGPLIVIHTHGRQITLANREGTYRQTFNAFQVKPYYRPEQDPSEVLFNQLQQFTSEHAPSSPFYDSLITEVITTKDPRSKEFTNAKQKEIQGLIDKSTWKIVLKDEVPDDANILKGRFVLAIKDAGTNKEVWKARYVVQGHRDKLKQSLVHDTNTARQYSVKMLVGLASIFGFRLYSTDVTQAYLQSADSLMRDVYIQPSKEFELGPDKMLKLLKPLYGLADSGDYWGRTLRQHLENTIGMKHTTNDGALFFKLLGDKLAGLCATYVDDCLHAGNPDYQKLSQNIEKSFQCRPRDWDNLQFAGVKIETYNNEFRIHQTPYISNLQPLPLTSDFKNYRSLRAKLSWITQTRPDIACAVALSTQITEERFNTSPVTYLKSLNSVITHLQENPDLPLRYPSLDRSSLKLQIYSDAAYGNNYDGSSQLSYILFLSDSSNKCQPIFWSSHKSKRVSRSVLGSETMALADAFDMAYTIRHDLEHMVQTTIPIVKMTDSLSLFNIITKATITAEKRLMIDLSTVKEAYKKGEFEDIGFIRTQYNPADALTKIKKNTILQQFIRTAVLEHPIEQWITRTWHGESDASKKGGVSIRDSTRGHQPLLNSI